MAKTSSIQRNLKRIRLTKKFAKKREALKKIIKTIKELNKKHGRVNASMIVENLPVDRSLIEEYLEEGRRWYDVKIH